MRLVSCLVLAGLSSRAVAEKPEAEKHKQAGAEAYQQKDFELARHELAAAYKIDPSPALLFAWAQAERYDGHCDNALPLYRQYLTTGPAREDADKVHSYITECEAKLPMPERDPAMVQRAPHDSPWYESKLGDALAITGVVGVFVGITYLGKSSGTADSAGHAADLMTYDHGLDQASTERTVGAVSLGLGGVLCAAAVYVYYDHHVKHRNEMLVSVGQRSMWLGARF